MLERLRGPEVVYTLRGPGRHRLARRAGTAGRRPVAPTPLRGGLGGGRSLKTMVEPLEDTVARAERAQEELAQMLDQLAAEREAVKAAATEAHEAIQGLRTAIREAKEEMRQVSKAEARKHLAKQMRAAADVLARDT